MKDGKTRQIIAWVLIGLFALFIGFNLKVAEIHFLLFKIEMPIAFVLLLSAAVGAGVTFAFRYIRRKQGEKEEGKEGIEEEGEKEQIEN